MTTRILERPTTAGMGSKSGSRTAVSGSPARESRTAPLSQETVPLDTFQPDRQQCEGIIEESYSSAEDEDVFAFERPITAAPKINNLADREPSSQSTTEIPAQDDAANPDPDHTRRPSIFSNRQSLISASSYFGTTEGDLTPGTSSPGASTTSFAKRTAKSGHRLRRLLQREKLDVIPGSREGSQGLTARAVDSTIPDGRMTRVDRLDNMIRQWHSEQGVEEPHFENGQEEDSPYEEVRASVSNMDDPEMPGKLVSAYSF